ncbi:hypothetical protein [Aequorivita xiaoshiensis]|uniref:Transposase n=1 Tax=Aequorivita xiaoshiensis TaxID=2874476 RepID=A0A9X1R1K1_9FLAO|nr:hypothetical protein [Aequorivita xiaoshiensis]MCG2431465.1 hypothetical protein [Aequorivita xiaoshiensis]
MFNAYSKVFNKKNGRVGSLFQRPFKRIKISEEKYLKQLIIYIHLNPENHRIIDNFENYKFSSYNSIISPKPTAIKRTEVIDFFNDIENFILIHRQRKPINENLDFIIE